MVEFFADCGITEKDVRHEYGEGLNYLATWVQFPTQEDRDRALQRQGLYLAARRISLHPGEERDWLRATVHRLAVHSKGRYVLVINLPELCTSEDVQRFFQGFDLLGNGVTFMHENRLGVDLSRKSSERKYRAVVRFASAEEAQRAIRTCHNGYMHTNQVKLRILA